MVKRNVFPQLVLVGEAPGSFPEGANKHFAPFLAGREVACLAPLFLVFPLLSRGPKIGTDNFRIGGANLQLGSGDGGVSLWTSGWQECLVSLN